MATSSGGELDLQRSKEERRQHAMERVDSHMDRLERLHREFNHVIPHTCYYSARVMEVILSGKIPSYRMMKELHLLLHMNEDNPEPGAQAVVGLGRVIRTFAEFMNASRCEHQGIKPWKYGCIPPVDGVPSIAPPTHLSTGRNLGNAVEVFPEELPIVPPIGSMVLEGADLERNDQVIPPMFYAPEFGPGFDVYGWPDLRSEINRDESEERFYINDIIPREEEAAKRGRKRGSRKDGYACNQCDVVCDNQHKYASHVRHFHPKTPAEAAVRKESRSRTEPRKTSDAGLIKATRASVGGDKPVERKLSNTGEDAVKKKGLVVRDYNCKVCGILIQTQQGYASHMRYAHRNDTKAKVAAKADETPKNPHPVVRPVEMKQEVPATPESALNTLASILSTTTSTKSGRMVRATAKSITKPDKIYACRVCGKEFDHPNAVAGHTRHCALVNNQPSARSVKRDVPAPAEAQSGEQSGAQTGAHTRAPVPAKLAPEDETPKRKAPVQPVPEERKAPIVRIKVAPIVEVQAVPAVAATPGRGRPRLNPSVPTTPSTPAPAAVARTRSDRSESAGDRPSSPSKRNRNISRAAQCAHRGMESVKARTCPYCNLHCVNIHAVDKHVKKEHKSVRDSIYGCSQCEKTFMTLGGLENHWMQYRDCPKGLLVLRGEIVDVDKNVEKILKLIKEEAGADRPSTSSAPDTPASPPQKRRKIEVEPTPAPSPLTLRVRRSTTRSSVLESRDIKQEE